MAAVGGGRRVGDVRPPYETGSQLGERHRPGLPGGELDGQRQAVDRPAQRSRLG
jgi:hypothetical protein